ncbi:UNVERIFIED_CONTAM: WD repeat-containing protein 74 [Siphonaria sp. JEL0065]|nr:WD repeat-containing protein 74 [Siphonaria sp. JEL0065]
MRIIVGDEVGLIKSIVFSEPATGAVVAENRRKRKKEALSAPPFAIAPLVGVQNRDRAVDCLCFSKNKTKAVAAAKDGHVFVVDLNSGAVDSLFRLFEPARTNVAAPGNKPRDAEHFVGLHEANGTIITCTNKGNIVYHNQLEYLAADEDAEPLPTITTNIGQDALTVMKVFPDSPDYFATAGAEREVCLWRIVKDPEGNGKLESIWKAKNVANDHLDLRVPVHVTDLTFMPPPAEYKAPPDGSVKPTRIAMVSLHKHFRVYNVYEGKRRPVVSVTVGDMPAKRLAVTKDGSQAVVTDTTGTAIHIETATGTRIGAFRGFQGAVTAMECVDEKDDALLVTAGIDRMLRIYLREGKRSLLHKIYLKHRLHTFIVDESFVAPSTTIKKKARVEKESDGNADDQEDDQEEEEENDEDFFARMAEPDEDDVEEDDNEEEEEEPVVVAPKKKKGADSTKSKKRNMDCELSLVMAALNALVTSNLVGFVNDVESFDNYIKTSIDTTNNPLAFGGTVRTNSLYNCPDWDGTGLRYLQSSLCAYLVGLGVDVSADATPNTPCNPAGTVVPLCSSTLTKFSAAWNTVFSSTTFCPSGAGTLGLGPNSLANYITSRQETLSSAASCVVAEGSETSNCGFQSAADAKKFCATSSVSADPCCSAFTPAVASMVSPPPATATVTTTTSAAAPSPTAAAENALPIPIIAGAGGGALLLIIGVVVFMCMRKKKQVGGNNNSSSNARGINNYDMEDRQQFSHKAAPMGFAPPPVPAGQQDMYEAIYDYTPNMSDELGTQVGDKIILKCEYDDGWAFGFNTRTKKEGTFPLDILDKYADPNANFNDANRNQRASSMYGPGGNNNAASMYAPTNNNTDSMYYAQSEYGNNTESVYYGNNTESVYAPAGTDSMYAPGTDSVYAPGGVESLYVDNKDVHEAVYDFTPQMPDEIELRVGDQVQLKHQYDDGWAQGTNLSNGNKTGLFPLDCLAGFDAPQQDANGKKQHNNRVSSMYGGGQDSVYYGNGTDSMYYPQSEYGTDSVYQANTDSVYYGNNTDSVYYGNGGR